MLREVAQVHQRNGEPNRRWFQSAAEDLIVWYADDDSIVGFQLCYDRPRNERALTWWRGTRVLERFKAAAGGLPTDLADFVCAKLRQYPSGE